MAAGRGSAVKPPFRWVGGKTKMLPFIAKYLPLSINRYLEPMMGGGALYFDYGLSAKECYLLDINKPLMSAYIALRDEFNAVRQIVSNTYPSIEYDELRAVFNEEKKSSNKNVVRLGSLFIALNHLCFNGVYRENLKGGFNVPRGDHGSGPTKRPRSLASIDWDHLELASGALAGTHLAIGSFTDWPAEWPHPGLGDVVFYDPPYAGEFSDYDAQRFTMDHHRQLHAQARAQAAAGATVIVCGSNNEWSWKIYGKPTEVVNVRRTVGNSLRGDATEALYVYDQYRVVYG